jgi:thiamine kinase-like enzyme
LRYGINGVWNSLHLSERLQQSFGTPISLTRKNREILKNSSKSKIWKLELQNNTERIPIILKIIKHPSRPNSSAELAIYREENKRFKGLLPAIYFIQHHVKGDHCWVCMEHVHPIKGQITFTPELFLKVIPSLAMLHARTYNNRKTQTSEALANHLPIYTSRMTIVKHREIYERSVIELEEAIKNNQLKKLIGPSYKTLIKILRNGPIYFPEVIESGESIIHSDLHISNMACSNIYKDHWKIKFIDWERARYAPPWYDLVIMLGSYFNRREKWKDTEEWMISRAATLYANEMAKHGILFKHDPVKLYKMTQLQHILENRLHLHLQSALQGRVKDVSISGYVEKIMTWGKELKLY